MKVLLIGHPNVGKSVIFNRLTGANVISSNYPGTTVDYTSGRIRHMGETIELIDVPGTFSLEPRDKAEEVAVRMLDENRDAHVICVIDATKIERGLYLALEIMERGFPMVLALNMWDSAIDKNVSIDTEKLEALLGVPVVPTVAVSGEGISTVVNRLYDATSTDVEGIAKRIAVGSIMTSPGCADCGGCSFKK